MPSVKDTAIKLRAVVWDTSGYINLDPQKPRVAPTPEDQQIFKRNFARLRRWADAAETANFMQTLNRWTGDYLHN